MKRYLRFLVRKRRIMKKLDLQIFMCINSGAPYFKTASQLCNRLNRVRKIKFCNQ